MSAPPEPANVRQLLSSSRYRHPGDVIRLIGSGLLLAGSLLASALASGWWLGPDAAYFTGIGSGAAGQAVTGIVQVAWIAAALLAIAAGFRVRRFRLLAGLVVAAGLAAGATVLLLRLVGGTHPDTLTTRLAEDSWIAGSQFPSPAFMSSAVAVVLVASPWLSRSWRRASWLGLLVLLLARLMTGTVLPMELLLAFATGLTVGSAVLVTLGVPDRRMGPDEIADALRGRGMDVAAVRAAPVLAKGSRPFVALATDERRWFVKALGSDQRDADLLYRAYRALRLRDVGDTRPAASLFDAVEHQALVGVMAQRAGVNVPSVDRVIRAADGSGLLVLEWVDGLSLQELGAVHEVGVVPEVGPEQISPEQIGPEQISPVQISPVQIRAEQIGAVHEVGAEQIGAEQIGAQISDDLLRQLWIEVDKLHQARIAHRSLRAANLMITREGQVRIVDFSFAELDATQRQIDLDLAELLASLATLIGEERAVATAVEGLGAPALGPAVPLLQPLALSAATRKAVKGQPGLLARTRERASLAGGEPPEALARLQRVKPQTLLAIVALSAAFYVLLPQLAQVEDSWQALQSAQWIWLPVVIGFSVLTYLASAVSLLGSVSNRPPFWPTALAQGASSFVNRVSPSNVGGMALNVRYLQKTGLPASAGVSAVGVDALAGALVHLVLLVTFLAWAGQDVSKAFKLPSSSTLLVILAIVAAVVGIVLATRPGRRFAADKLVPGFRSSFANLRQVAQSPVKLILLFGGSAAVTLAYIGGLAAAVAAFGAGVSLADVGAIYLLSSMIAAASPTPGGLGAIEAALVAGLTGIGISSGLAVAAVLTYRLATYWLPVVPGWFSLRALQRLDYV